MEKILNAAIFSLILTILFAALATIYYLVTKKSFSYQTLLLEVSVLFVMDFIGNILSKKDSNNFTDDIAE